MTSERDMLSVDVRAAALKLQDAIISLGACLSSVDGKDREDAMRVAYSAIVDSDDVPHPTNLDPVYELMRHLKFGFHRRIYTFVIHLEGVPIVAIPDWGSTELPSGVLDAYATKYAMPRADLSHSVVNQIPSPTGQGDYFGPLQGVRKHSIAEDSARLGNPML